MHNGPTKGTEECSTIESKQSTCHSAHAIRDKFAHDRWGNHQTEAESNEWDGTSTVPMISDATFLRAVENVANWGDTDIFPFPVENNVFFDRPSETVRVLQELSRTFDAEFNQTSVSSYSSLAPVGYTGFRWATQIDPIWNAYFLAAVLELAPAIEAVRLPTDKQTVFSYRLNTQTSDGLFQLGSWQLFQAQTRSRATACKYVVQVDIADFYSRVYHHRIDNALNEVDAGRGITVHIMKLLSRLSNGTSYGLPVGGPAARILSELLLNRVDRLLLAEKSTENFTRYADDYRFFVDDLPSAYRALGYLSEKLQRNEGLSLQKAKTRIVTSSEFVSMLDPVDPLPGSAEKFLNLHIHYDPYSATAAEDYEHLTDQLEEFDIFQLLQEELRKQRIHSALTRRLITTIKYIDAPVQVQAVLSLIDNIDTLAPILPQVMIVVRECLSNFEPADRELVVNRVRKLIEDQHPIAQIDLNLAYMIRVLAELKSADNERMLIGIYNGPHGFGSGPAPNIQRDIMIAMARWNVRYWISDQKNYIASAHPWVRRAFWLASYTLGDEGAHWRQANRLSMLGFDAIVKEWMESRVQQTSWTLPL